MKVLVIDTVEFDLNGITSVILNYDNQIDKSNLDMDYVLVSSPVSDLRNRLKENGAKVFIIERKKHLLSYMWNLYKVIRNGDYSIVHIHGNSATMTFELFTAWAAGVPVRIAHSHNTSCTYFKIHKILLPFFKVLYTHGFACGKEAGEWLFDKQNFEIINNGIDLEKFSLCDDIRNMYRQKLNVTDQIVIGHVGNFVAQKNHMFLLSVFAELIKKNRGYKLVLVGAGPLEDEIRQKVQFYHLDNYVEFIGKSFEVDRYLQAMDIFVLPSLYEGLPVSMIEAQAAGLPCIVSDRISMQSALTNLVKFLSIESADVWCKYISKISYPEVERESRIEKYHDQIRKSGYDIRYNAQRLKKLYMEYVQQ